MYEVALLTSISSTLKTDLSQDFSVDLLKVVKEKGVYP